MSYTPISAADEEKLIQVSLSVSRATIKGTLVIGIIQGALGGIGFAVAGIDSAVFWGAVMAVLSVLPGIGSMLVLGPMLAALFLAVLAIYSRVFEDLLIEPKEEVVDGSEN